MMKTQAFSYLLNQQRIALVDSMSTEYLSILAILYGDQIESGIKRVSDYNNMTMLEAENELRIRTLMMRGQRLHKKRDLLEEHQANEQALLDQLKRSTE